MIQRLAIATRWLLVAFCLVFFLGDLSCRSVGAATANGGYCNFNSDCGSGYCKGSYCCSIAGLVGQNNAPRCSQCRSGDGVCITCNSEYFMDPSGFCYLLTSNGGYCSEHYQCSGGTCKNSACCNSAGKSSYCTSCGGTGACNACTSPAYLSSGQCVVPSAAGAMCSFNQGCSSGSCKTRCCNSNGQGSECSRCDSSGNCDLCASSTHYLSSGACILKIPNGGSCLDSYTCASSSCKTLCCGSKGQDSACMACNAAGDCAQCASNYVLVDGSCILKVTNGGSCVDNDRCVSGVCRGKVCCNVDDTSGGRNLLSCLACRSPDGLCNQCTTDSYLDPFGYCQPLVPSGGYCTSNSMCARGPCQNSVCCDVYSCASCQGGSGYCTACESPLYLSSGKCVLPLDIGQPCSSNQSCYYSGTCKTNCCSTKGQVSACDVCNFNGDCSQCASSHFLYLGACYPKLPDGSAGCSPGTGVCQSGVCKTRCCRDNDLYCAACDDLGNCAECYSTHTLSLDSSPVCEPKRGDGSPCSVDRQCVSDSCKGGGCCNSMGQDSLCLICSGNGSCGGCSSGFTPLDGVCSVITLSPTLDPTSQSPSFRTSEPTSNGFGSSAASNRVVHVGVFTVLVLCLALILQY